MTPQLVDADREVVDVAVERLVSGAVGRAVRQYRREVLRVLEKPHHDTAAVAVQREADREVGRAAVVADGLDRGDQGAHGD